MVSFFSWWYGPGWAQVIHSFGNRIKNTLELFSVTQLLRTLFAPWKRIVSYPGASLGDKLQALGDNIVSRAIGFIVRLLFLIGALISIVAIAAATVLEIALWPLLPLAVPTFLILGVLL